MAQSFKIWRRQVLGNLLTQGSQSADIKTAWPNQDAILSLSHGQAVPRFQAELFHNSLGKGHLRLLVIFTIMPYNL